MSESTTGGGSGDGGRLGRIPEQVAKQAAGIGRAVGDAVGPKAEDIANRSKAAGAEAVADVARTAEALADTVAPTSPAIAEYVRGAGQKIDRLASDLRDKKVGDLLAAAAEFGRSQPGIMLAGAALIGFALSRVVKAGVAGACRTRAKRQCLPRRPQRSLLACCINPCVVPASLPWRRQLSRRPPISCRPNFASPRLSSRRK